MIFRSTGKALATTADHLFWNATDREWQEAKAFDPGDTLFVSAGKAVPVGGLVWATTRLAPAYNLTVEDLHTYYVLAGATPVLVHNSNCYNISPEAESIAAHANQRFMDPGGFEHYVKGVNPNALDAYVDGVLDGVVPNVQVRYLNNGRVAYWDPAKGAVVIEDGAGGTVFTPTNGKTYFDDLQ